MFKCGQFFIGIIIGLVLIPVATALPLNTLKLPPGFQISIYAHVPDARQMTLGDNGVVYVGSREAGNVYAVTPSHNYTKADKVITIAKHLNMPNGVAYRQGALYVAEVNRILRFDNIGPNLAKPPNPTTITDKLPSNSYHGWRYIAFGPDDRLYIGIGAPCNVCLETDKRYATIMRMQPDGSQLEVYVKGVRNTMGFAWHPINSNLWFTDNGRDWMGDNSPPDELNVAKQKGLDFGFPYYHGMATPDPIYGKIRAQKEFSAPTYELPAHVAALGMIFYTGKMFPSDYQNQILIAEHGSWNRSQKIGYQVIFVKVADDQVMESKPFITGWLQGEHYWGRPVDLLVMPDGSVLLSDDEADVIYRITYQPKTAVGNTHTTK